jgi:hypothetical protein
MRKYKRLSKPALHHLVVLNIATGILLVRKEKEVMQEAVTITEDKKVLNQKRKELAKLDEKLREIAELATPLIKALDYNDLQRLKKFDTDKIVMIIPTENTNLEVLALYLLYIEFQDAPDPKMSSIFEKCKEYDYFSMIIEISENIGLTKDVSEYMYNIAHEMIRAVNE